MPSNPDVTSWTRLQNHYLNRKMPTKVLRVFLELILSNSAKPNSHSIVAALSACARSKDIRTGRMIHGMSYKYLRESSPNVDNALIDMYGKNKRIDTARRVFTTIGFKDVAIWTSLLNGYLLNGDIQTAKQVFDEMPQRNIFSWTSMIVGHVRNSKPGKALELFLRMQRNNDGEHCYDPTAVTIVALLSGCADIGALNLGSSIHGYVNKRMGFVFNVAINNGLIDMYSKSGHLESAVGLFESMRSKDLFSWTSMISGLALNGNGRNALVVFNAMEESGIIPNEVTFLSVLSACSHSGLVIEGERLFEKFVSSYHVKPRIQHYGCMVDLFVRAGCLEKAMEFIGRMPMKVDVLIWKSVLYGACSGDNGVLELAEMAGKKVIELDPGDEAPYVLLWSIYRSRKRWDDASRVMRMMRDGRIKKKPGCSWVEVNGVVFEFLPEGFSVFGSRDYTSDKNDNHNAIMLVLNLIFQHSKLDNTGHDNDILEVIAPTGH